MNEQKLTADEWWAEVLRICAEMSYPEWFYADKEAWLEAWADGETPFDAVKYQLECAA